MLRSGANLRRRVAAARGPASTTHESTQPQSAGARRSRPASDGTRRSVSKSRAIGSASTPPSGSADYLSTACTTISRCGIWSTARGTSGRRSWTGATALPPTSRRPPSSPPPRLSSPCTTISTTKTPRPTTSRTGCSPLSGGPDPRPCRWMRMRTVTPSPITTSETDDLPADGVSIHLVPPLSRMTTVARALRRWQSARRLP